MRYNGRVVWLWCWLGVLVASCGQSTLPGPTSRSIPATLLGLTRPPTTPTPIPRLLRTLTPWATNLVALTTVPTPLPLTVSAPSCYETPVSGLWCLGILSNLLPVPLSHISVHVYLVSADGTALAVQNSIIPRDILLPGETSPYGVLFDTSPANNIGPVASVVSAIEAVDVLKDHAVIQVQNARGELHSPIYAVSGTLVNRTAKRVRHMSVTVTLFDSGNRVTGFRQIRWPEVQTLDVNETLPFSIDMTPQGRGTIRFEAIADAQPD